MEDIKPAMFKVLPAKAQQVRPHVMRMSAWLRVCVFWLAIGLLLAQSLAQLHGVKHGTLTHAASATSAPAARSDTGFLDLLFSSHGSGKDCRLYDQAHDGHALLAVAAGLLPVVLPSLAVAIFQGKALARWAALFDARGPPLTF